MESMEISIVLKASDSTTESMDFSTMVVLWKKWLWNFVADFVMERADKIMEKNHSELQSRYRGNDKFSKPIKLFEKILSFFRKLKKDENRTFKKII
jgi:hypothetical protein